MSKINLKIAINAYYDGIFTSRDVLFRLLDYLDTTPDVVIQALVDRCADREIAAEDAIQHIDYYINVVVE